MLTLALLAPLLGCNLFAPDSEARPERSRRVRRYTAAASSSAALPTAALEKLRAIHPDVQFERHVTLADFQSSAPDSEARPERSRRVRRPRQVKCFRVSGPDGSVADRIQPSLAAPPGADGSAERVLAASLGGPEDVLLLDVPAFAQPTPPGDWREFGVLLLSIHAPPGGVELTFSLTAGASGPLSWAEPVHAEPGWNHLRIDLDEIGRHVDLAQVRTLAWRLSPGGRPVTLHFDDLVLADRTRWLVGQDGGLGELYALSRGRRLFVGVRERFELVFRGGVIVGWHADSPDNLTAGAGLGPWLTALPEHWSAQGDIVLPTDSRANGERSAAGTSRQTVLESSAFRVVVEGGCVRRRERREADGSATAPDPQEHSWRHVIYPDGRVFVRALSELPGPPQPDSRLGYAVVLEGRSGFRLVAPLPADPHHEAARFVLLSRAGAERADLFWTCATPAASARRRLLQPDDQRPLVLLTGEVPAAQSVQTAHLLRFWPPDLGSASAAEPLAGDYQHPVALRPAVGRLVTDAPGDLDRDGYNESEGAYEIALHRGLARFEFDPGARPRFDPVFRIQGSTGLKCWVYADGEALPADRRDAAGRLLFALPGTVRAPRLIEVYTRPSAAPDAQQSPSR